MVPSRRTSIACWFRRYKRSPGNTEHTRKFKIYRYFKEFRLIFRYIFQLEDAGTYVCEAVGYPSYIQGQKVTVQLTVERCK